VGVGWVTCMVHCMHGRAALEHCHSAVMLQCFLVGTLLTCCSLESCLG
jgi:hypothetical protein